MATKNTKTIALNLRDANNLKLDYSNVSYPYGVDPSTVVEEYTHKGCVVRVGEIWEIAGKPHKILAICKGEDGDMYYIRDSGHGDIGWLVRTCTRLI